jgi:predicted metalloprotease
VAPARRAPRRPFATLLASAAVVVVALVVALAVGGRDAGFRVGDPFEDFSPAAATPVGREVERAPSRRRDLAAFLRFVVDDIQGFWAHEFQRTGLTYRPADVVVFRRAVRSGCGIASSATGPFYCSLDETVYLDPGFFRELAVVFRAPGDFAEAYVLAHELGHHVQHLTGISDEVQVAMQRDPASANALSIRLELQADCLAGVWGRSTYERGLLERGDLDEAIRAAAAVGDDRIQRRTTGRIQPETWTHGSSVQRRTWYRRGFDAGDPDACDTFSAANV